MLKPNKPFTSFEENNKNIKDDGNHLTSRNKKDKEEKRPSYFKLPDHNIGDHVSEYLEVENFEELTPRESQANNNTDDDDDDDNSLLDYLIDQANPLEEKKMETNQNNMTLEDINTLLPRSINSKRESNSNNNLFNLSNDNSPKSN